MRSVCTGGKLVFLLEGGYSLQGLSEGVVETFLAALDLPSRHAPDAEVPEEPMAAVQETLDRVKAIHGL